MRKARLMTASALSIIAAVPSAAFAADPPTAMPAQAAATAPVQGDAQPVEDTPLIGRAAVEDIIVTGSRIRRPNLDSTVPVTSMGGEILFQQGQTNVGDTLNELPQLRSTVTQQNPGTRTGVAGLNLLDLRGLGTQRTLVLVNGRRHVASDILINAVSVDVNTIPSDLVERVDLVTGGSSAIYGSDAIAGVVNFVLRRNFDGVQVRGQAGVTEAGFGGNQFVSAMAGRNFADGRGNVTLQGEYARTDRVFASDVPAFRTNDNFLVVDADGGPGIVNGSDNVFDRGFFRDIRSATIDYRGLVTINQRNIPNTGPCGNATAPNNGASNTAGAAFSCTYIFSPEGRLIQQTGTRFGNGINSSILGGNGQTGREGRTVSILPFTERYNFNALAHFEFSPAADAFFEGKWNRVNALGNNLGPTANLNNGTLADFRERPRLDNPFLNPADRTTLASLILGSGCRSDPQVICPAAGNLNAGDLASIANGSYRFVTTRNLVDVGLRDEAFQRDTYRFVGGLRGTFNDDWSYEVSLNYGKFEETTRTTGYVDRQRFALAMDAGRNPVTGQIQCRSQYDPAAAVQLASFAPSGAAAAAQYNAAQAARLAADVAACVPYNPFGTADNRASANYFSRDFTSGSGLTQFVASGFVSGDTSQVFELPGGPIRFALGAEYRRETAFYRQDPFVQGGFTNAVSIPSFTPKPFEVKEGFGEVQIPILSHRPFFEELTLSGAARVAKYQGSVGTVWSYNAGVDYAPVRDIRFRANYSRAVRAPNVTETGFPLTPTFADSFADPCNPFVIGTGTRATNCAADLGALLPTLANAIQSLPIQRGSNPNLSAESSDSYTYGVVLQPRWIKGLSVSVDYYDIKVKNIIATLSAQTIVNNCYDSPTINNIFCQQFTRWRGPGTGPLGENPGRILGNSLVSAPLNFAARVRRGIDVNFAYRGSLSGVNVNTNLVYTHNLEISDFQDPLNPNFETNVLKQPGDPKDELRWDLDLGLGPVTLGYQLRYIGPMYVNRYADVFSINDRPPSDVDAFPVVDYPSVMYHDLRVDLNVAKNKDKSTLNFYFGVDNIFDQKVPDGALTATSDGGIYAFRGRNFYAGFRATF